MAGPVVVKMFMFHSYAAVGGALGMAADVLPVGVVENWGVVLKNGSSSSSVGFVSRL